jgi:hypothetical protein
MTGFRQSEYEALRATIRERGTMRLCAVLAGLAAWGALAIALLSTELQGAVTLVPLLLLAATFEISFFVHTGVERIGRYIQVVHEEATGGAGWETIAMNYGARFQGGLDPLFVTVFSTIAATNFLISFAAATRRPGWLMLSVIAHLAFGYRIVIARRLAAAQRALDLDRYRKLLESERQTNV